MKILLFTDSRGQHKPAGSRHKLFGERLSEIQGLEVESYLCPYKWTTTLDFIEQFQAKKLAEYDHVILYTGIVDWSPRKVSSARNDLYENRNTANLGAIQLSDVEYGRKAVNYKKPTFDRVFGESNMASHLDSPFGVHYEGEDTINMYGLVQAREKLIPLLKAIPNLIFINSNRFVPGWRGDYPRDRPSNITVTETYSRLFQEQLSDRTIDLLAWDVDEVMRYTCDNLHLSEAGSDYIFSAICERIHRAVVDTTPELHQIKSRLEEQARFMRLVYANRRIRSQDYASAYLGALALFKETGRSTHFHSALLAASRLKDPEKLAAILTTAERIARSDVPSTHAESKYLKRFGNLIPGVVRGRVAELASRPPVPPAELDALELRLQDEEALGEYIGACCEIVESRLRDEFFGIYSLPASFPYNYLSDYRLNQPAPIASTLDQPKSVGFVYNIKNRSRRTRASILSLARAHDRWLAADERVDLRIEVLVAEDTGDDPFQPKTLGTLPFDLKHVLVETGVKWTRSGMVNQGLRRSEADVVLFVDADILFPEDFIIRLQQALKNVDATKHVFAFNTFETHTHTKDGLFHTAGMPYGYVWGLLRRHALAVGGFDEAYIGWGSEDRDFEYRVTKHQGLTVVSSLFLPGTPYVMHLSHDVRIGRESRDENQATLRKLKSGERDRVLVVEPTLSVKQLSNQVYSAGKSDRLPNPATAQSHSHQREGTSPQMKDSQNPLDFGKVATLAEAGRAGGGSECETLLPEVHAAMRTGHFEMALSICRAALQRHEGPPMHQLFMQKQAEIIRSMRLADEAGMAGHRRTSDTLVILGNGPSLKYVMGNPKYREVLKRYDTFGLNAAYRAYDELGFWPTYHGCLDMIVVESHRDSYRAILPKLKRMFLLSEDHLGNDIIGYEDPKLTKIRFDRKFRDSNTKTVSTDFGSFRNWQNSGCNCVQIGLMLGYKKIALLGMDASYKEFLREAEVVRDEKYEWDHLQITKDVKANDNYWFSGYQQVGDKYNIPNAEKYHLPAWNALGTSEHKERIVNCTTETKISTITRRSFEETFGVVPAYRRVEEEDRLYGFNVDAANLMGRLVMVGSLIFLVTEEAGVIVRKFVTESAFNSCQARGGGLRVLFCDESLLDLPCHGVIEDLGAFKNDRLKPGLTFMVRAKNEKENIGFVLGSLNEILSDVDLNCQLLFVDNMSSDNTFDEVVRVCKDAAVRNVFLTRYDVEVCRSGEAHTKLQGADRSRSLDTYYNWCLDRVMTNYVVKWDCDFLALPGNLRAMIKQHSLDSSDEPLAIWCTGKTLFKKQGDYFVNEDTMYNEFRVFSKSNGYRWEYAPRWEICSQEYMIRAVKKVFAPCVFLELKDLGRNEFEYRSHGTAIKSDVRDKRDAEIIEALSASGSGVLDQSLRQLAFDPLEPSAFDAPSLNGYEATSKELGAMQSYWLNVYAQPNSAFHFENKGNAVVQGLWVGEEITDIHRLCIESFLKQGHCFVLYTYGPVRNVPQGVVIKNANTVVPSGLIYQYGGSYAGFSDLFRNKLLYMNGGWYVDLDIFCLKRFDIKSEIVFSMDHYDPENLKKKLGGNEIIDNKYYVATNPCKLPAGHDLARGMYSTIFRKLAFDRLKKVWLETVGSVELDDERLKEDVSSIVVKRAIDELGIRADFEEFVGLLSALPEKLSFHELLEAYGVAAGDLGQKTWGEIGPTLITREIVARGLEKYASKPEMFQGIVKYFEIEKFLDPGFDYASALDAAGSYSIDLFFTMWRRKGLVQRFSTDEPCLIRYMRQLVTDSVVAEAA